MNNIFVSIINNNDFYASKLNKFFLSVSFEFKTMAGSSATIIWTEITKPLFQFTQIELVKISIKENIKISRSGELSGFS